MPERVPLERAELAFTFDPVAPEMRRRPRCIWNCVILGKRVLWGWGENVTGFCFCMYLLW